MGFIDEKRSVSELPIKPRRSKGTYAHKARNYFATAVILGASLIGLAWTFLPSTGKIRDSVAENFWTPETDDFKLRKYQMRPFGGPNSSKDIETLMKDLGRDVGDKVELPKEE